MYILYIYEVASKFGYGSACGFTVWIGVLHFDSHIYIYIIGSIDNSSHIYIYILYVNYISKVYHNPFAVLYITTNT